MEKLKIKQYKSGIGTSPNQKRTLKALGLNKVGKEIIHDNSPAIMGMINVVNHLVKVEKV